MGLEEKRNSEYDGSSFGIDLNSETLQKMSEELTTHAVLQETVYGWLQGTTLYFCSDLNKLTYADFVNHIGCDATEYRFDSKYQARTYTWRASDKPIACLCALFKEKEGAWRIYSTGSAQVRMPDDFIDNLGKKQKNS